MQEENGDQPIFCWNSTVCVWKRWVCCSPDSSLCGAEEIWKLLQKSFHLRGMAVMSADLDWKVQGQAAGSRGHVKFGLHQHCVYALTSSSFAVLTKSVFNLSSERFSLGFNRSASSSPAVQTDIRGSTGTNVWLDWNNGFVKFIPERSEMIRLNHIKIMFHNKNI